jgi:hypothetical protein
VASLLRSLVRALDALVRRILGVCELSPEARSLVRIRPTRARRQVCLADITIRPGDPLLELHLWNEHVPPLPATGADAAWAVRVLNSFRASLREVAQRLQTPAWEGVKALHGTTSLVGAQDASLALMRHLGFSVVAAARGPLGRFGELWDNAYAWALLWAFNPLSLRHRSWTDLRRMEIWVSREAFLRRYGRRIESTAPAAARVPA